MDRKMTRPKMARAKIKRAVVAVFIAAALMTGYGTPATGSYHEPPAPPTTKPETPEAFFTPYIRETGKNRRR